MHDGSGQTVYRATVDKQKASDEMAAKASIPNPDGPKNSAIEAASVVGTATALAVAPYAAPFVGEGISALGATTATAQKGPSLVLQFGILYEKLSNWGTDKGQTANLFIGLFRAGLKAVTGSPISAAGAEGAKTAQTAGMSAIDAANKINDASNEGTSCGQNFLMTRWIAPLMPESRHSVLQS